MATPTKKMLGGISISIKGVEIHPDVWAELEQTPPEVRTELMNVIESFKTALANCHEKYGDDFDVEQFNAEVAAITGSEPEELDVDEEDEETMRKIAERLSNMPERH